jgi:hypothetical protein
MKRVVIALTAVIALSAAVGASVRAAGGAETQTFPVNFVETSASCPSLMTDAFSLAGAGPARLHNGFVADIVTDFGALFTFAPRQSHGDPIDFSTGASVCDPL